MNRFGPFVMFALLVGILCASAYGAQQKRQVTYSVMSDSSVFVTVTLDGKDAWPGGHYLNEEELGLYNSDNREILDKRFCDFAIALQAKSAPAEPSRQIAEQKVTVDADIEAKAVEKQAIIDAAKPEEDK